MCFGYPYDYNLSPISLNSNLLDNAEGSDYVHLIDSKKRSRSLRRRLKRVFGKRKFSRLSKKMIEFQKYSLICFVGNPAVPLNEEERLISLFKLCATQAWEIFLKLGSLLLQLLKTSSRFVMKFVMSHPWMITFGVFASCALLIFSRLVKGFKKNLRWHNALVLLILILLFFWLLAETIKAKSFNIVLEEIYTILKSILRHLFLFLRKINSLLDKKMEDLESHSLPMEDKLKPPTGENFQTFALYSILSLLLLRYLLARAKRELVDAGPLSDIVIEIIDRLDFNKLDNAVKIINKN